MQIQEAIAEAVSCIKGNEASRKTVAQKLRKLVGQQLDLYEDRLVYPVRQTQVNGKVAGVDSGFVEKSIHSIDLVLIRAAGVVFEYQAGLVTGSAYYPAYFQFPVPHLSSRALDSDELGCSKSLLRLREEIGTAKALIERYHPDFAFLDGSIIPQYLDKPRKDSKVNALYHGLLNEFQSLYALAEAHACTLVATVEDSRGSRFRQIVQEEILPAHALAQPSELDNLFDSGLLEHLLEKGERSFAFPYSKSIREHPILMDLDEKWGRNIHAFYLKPSDYDRPLRVEFIHQGNGLTKAVDRIAETVLALASLHREYAYPSILIEADLRARLKPEEINIVYNKIVDKLGKNVQLGLRREKRPF